MYLTFIEYSVTYLQRSRYQDYEDKYYVIHADKDLFPSKVIYDLVDRMVHRLLGESPNDKLNDATVMFRELYSDVEPDSYFNLTEFRDELRMALDAMVKANNYTCNYCLLNPHTYIGNPHLCEPSDSVWFAE